MHVPAYFENHDRAQVIEHIRRHPFGTLISTASGAIPVASHIPMFLGADGMLWGHIAKGNPHYKCLSGPALAVFQGPAAYVSPRWYRDPPTVVPTINFVAVHVSGEVMLAEGEGELRRVLERTVEIFESPLPEPWSLDIPADYEARLLGAIVGFKMRIDRMQGLWKLSQNHSKARKSNVIAALRARADAPSLQVAELMESWDAGTFSVRVQGNVIRPGLYACRPGTKVRDAFAMARSAVPGDRAPAFELRRGGAGGDAPTTSRVGADEALGPDDVLTVL